MKRKKFNYRLWHWTLGSENLFDLDPRALATYTLLCDKAVS